MEDRALNTDVVKKCRTQDTNGSVCGKKLSKLEFDQDGMCEICAGNVWLEMTTKDNNSWVHSHK